MADTSVDIVKDIVYNFTTEKLQAELSKISEAKVPQIINSSISP